MRASLAAVLLYLVLRTLAGGWEPQWQPTPANCWPGAHVLTAEQDARCEVAADSAYDRDAAR